jgi:uncharacterized membrane protein HdeD (DUF308 family)
MLNFITREWWVFLVRGIAAIIFGATALVWPGPTLVVLVFMFGAYMLVDGITMLVALIRGDTLARSNASAVGTIGVLGIVAGIVTFFWPDATALTLLYVVAFWAIAMGVIQMFTAIALRREIDGEFWMGLGGLISVAFGTYLILFPGAGLLSLVWLVGFWAITFGVSSIGLAFRLRSVGQELQSMAPVA